MKLIELKSSGISESKMQTLSGIASQTREVVVEGNGVKQVGKDTRPNWRCQGVLLG